METGCAGFSKLTSIPEELHNFEDTLISSGGTPGILGEFSAVRQTPATVSSTRSGDRQIWAFRDCNRSHLNKHIGDSSVIKIFPAAPGHLSVVTLAGQVIVPFFP